MKLSSFFVDCQSVSLLPFPSPFHPLKERSIALLHGDGNRMLGSKDLLIDGYGALVEGLGLLVLPLGSVEFCQVVEGSCGLRVIET